MDEEIPQAGDTLVRWGAAVFAVGAAATIATVVPLFVGASRLPSPAYFASMLMPVGFGVALLGLVRAARARRS